MTDKNALTPMQETIAGAVVPAAFLELYSEFMTEKMELKHYLTLLLVHFREVQAETKPEDFELYIKKDIVQYVFKAFVEKPRKKKAEGGNEHDVNGGTEGDIKTAEAIVALLFKEGFLKSTLDQDDRRRHRVSVGEYGKTVIANMAVAMTSIMGEALFEMERHGPRPKVTDPLQVETSLHEFSHRMRSIDGSAQTAAERADALQPKELLDAC